MLDPTQEQELERLFNEALDLPESERGPLVAQARERDPLLGERLEALLAEDAAGTHEVFQREFPAMVGVPKVGPYRLLSVLGEGGMGTVFLAQQEAPVRRKVALKMIRAGMASETVVARFEAERETLARMEHSGIARMYFAGMTDDGRPYLAMEYVDGQPLGRYCREERCTLAERIELFGQICDAVQYAHQQGIIHRDLKPTNILVTTQDGKPQPKIIDFGIARATAGSLISSVEETYPGGAPGTRAYMSPEQASGRPVDTRSDIHALGVMLYEMLVGELPFDVRALAAQGLGELQRALVEVDPPTPSKRFRRLEPPVAERHAEERRTSVRSLGEALQGDLDWITMRAIEKHPAQRYPSASELKADLVRHLSDEPVTAGPPTTSYRVAKFVRRHRVGTVLTSLTVLSVLIAFAATLHSLQGTRRAAARERQLGQEIALRGLRNKAVAELFVYALPGDLTLSSAMTVREMIEHAAEGLRERFAGRPEEEAAARYVLGTTFLRLGDVESAHEQFGKAYANQLTFESGGDEAVFRTLSRLVHTTYLLEGEEAVTRLRDQCTELALGILEKDDPKLGARLRRLVEAAVPAGNEVQAEVAARELTAVLAELAQDSNATPAGVWLVASLAAERPEVAHLPADEGYLSELWDIAEGQMRHEQIESLTLRWFVARNHLSRPSVDFARAAEEASVLADETARHLPPGHWLRVDADRLRGEAASGLGSFEEAESALLDAQRVAERHDTHPTFPLVKTRVALARLADAWQATGTDWIQGSFERWRAAQPEGAREPRTDWWVVRTPGAAPAAYGAAYAWLASEACEDVPGIEVLRGMALVRSGDHAAGLEVLQGIESPVAGAFRVLALRGLGKGETADTALTELVTSLSEEVSVAAGPGGDAELAGYLAEARRGARQP